MAAMIVKSRKQLPLLVSDMDAILPVLPIKSTVLLPGEKHIVQLALKENLAMLQTVMEENNQLIVSYSPRPAGENGGIDLSEVSVLAQVESARPGSGGSRMVTLIGVRRVALTDIRQTSPYLEASYLEIAENGEGEKHPRWDVDGLVDLVTRLAALDHDYPPEMINRLQDLTASPGEFADRAGALIHIQPQDKQEILDAVDVADRLEAIKRLLTEEVEKTALAKQIDKRVGESLEKKKREIFLRQQLMEIRRELGEEFVEEDLSRLFHNKIRANRALPQEIADRLLFEAARLKHISSSSAEYGAIKNYLELVLSLPWNKPPAEPYDLVAVDKKINAEYYGSTPIKEQVLEYLAVWQSSRELQDLPVLCLAGPVGTGKASLVRAMADAMGRRFVRINGTSLTAMEDIKGGHRTEVGAGPGYLIRSIIEAASFDLVIFVEDLEYIIESADTNALLALFEAVDPRHNRHFTDNYVGIPFDFSRILFVLGISYMDDFPEPFMHHLEMVEMPGYIEREKVVIARRHILPKLYKRYGLARTELKFSDRALTRIIRQYTMEAGLIGLQQQLEKIFRKATRRKASGEVCKIALTESNVDQFLGTQQFIPEKATSRPEIGVATGLAWTGAGGDLMLIEGLKMRGTGQVIFTGSLGEIMKESIQAAHSFVRARAETLGIDHNDFASFDIHIHFPMGAIPKDGPSAGMTVSLVIASVMAERPIRNDVAITGEVTLRGKVLPVGGVKEKVSAAYRAGIFTIILPKENEKDIKNIPREIVRKTRFIFIETVDELFEQGLLDFTPSTFTLEKLFAEEVKKAKRRGTARKTGRRPARKPAAKRVSPGGKGKSVDRRGIR